MEISVELFDKICRICLLQSAELKSLFSKANNEDRNLLEILAFTASIDVKIGDSLPKQVCSACESIMCKADAFKRRCHEAQTILNNALQNATIPGEIPKFSQNYSIKVEKTDLQEKLGGFGTVVSSMSRNRDVSEDVEKNVLQNYAICTESPVKEELSNIEEESDYLDNFETGSQCGDVPLNSITKVEKEIKTGKKKIGILYECFCHSRFSSKDKYKSHLKEKECNTIKIKNIRNKIQCIKCNSQFNSPSDWKAHQDSHCTESLSKPKDSNENARLTEKEELFQCSLCLRRFKFKTSLSAHIKRHEQKDNIKHVCKICKREFKYKAYLENHILNAHSRKNGFTCDVCEQCFLDKGALETHKKCHEDEKKHSCTVCNKAFYMLCTLKEHMRTHTGEKPYLCSQCGKSFSQKTNLAQHTRRHQGLKPFKCESCDKRFVSKGELEAHARKHSGAHPFVCDECGNGFTTSSALVKHRRIHTGERPYQCDLCPMRFAASGTLKNHRRTHTGERPFQCSFCDKAFVQRNDLISHIRCHTGEKPYICTQCGQSFRKAGALKSHLKIHIKDPIVGVNALLTSMHCMEH